MMYTKLICLALLGSVMFATAGKMVEPEMLESCGDDLVYKKPAQCPCKEFGQVQDTDWAATGVDLASEFSDLVNAAIEGAFPGSDLKILGGDCLENGDFNQCIMDSVRNAQNAYYHVDSSQIQLSDNIGQCGAPVIKIGYLAVPEEYSPYYYEKYGYHADDGFSTVCVDDFLGCNEHHGHGYKPYGYGKYHEKCGPVAKATVQVCIPLCCECCEDITAAFSGRNQPYSSSKNAEADLCFKMTVYAGTQTNKDKESGDSVLIAECCPEMNLQACRSPNAKQCARLSCDARSSSQSNRRQYYH